jgi:hypothetical protein
VHLSPEDGKKRIGEIHSRIFIVMDELSEPVASNSIHTRSADS